MRILLLADLHIGTIKDINYHYANITNIIDKEITLTGCDMVVILGDYFDRLFKVNEEFVSLAINVMSFLVRTCIKTRTKIRIVYGTESHEMDQYRLFNHFLSSKTVDMKLFTTCTEEIVNGKKILYVPEEYMQNKYDFYKDTIYGEKNYDYVFGHGVIAEGMPAQVSRARETDAINTENKVPHFNTTELSKSGKLVVFGHQHKPWDCENVHYLGSLNRWCFGEEDDKRYGIIEDDKLTFVTNEDAFIYKTYEFASDNPIYESADNIMNEVKRIKDENREIFDGTKFGKIRLLFHVPENVDPTFHDNLKSLLFNDKNITTLLKETYTETVTEESAEVEQEMDFIIDNTIQPDDKIYNFIMKSHEDLDLSLKELKSYIHDPLEL